MIEPAKKYSILLTDLYQLTMAYAYWQNRIHEHTAVFHVSFRSMPFHSGYCILAGLADAVDYLNCLTLNDAEADYLASLPGDNGERLFSPEFIDYLRRLEFSCDLDAIREGTPVFPHEPLLRVRGPILQAQILETALLNIINFQTLIATKAARVCHAAKGDPVLEFGLRRAQGIDGGIAASRAAFIGGCSATSNVFAGMQYGIPVRGTHAHSWVMAFDSEEDAFRAYARAMPHNAVFLVDTYDSLEGVRNAIVVGRELRNSGHKFAGIRLDSGDLAYLSIESRRLLDEAGFPEAAIIASNDLDEQVIASLKEQGATVGIWGVGTKLVTAYDHPAMGGVYKLSALRRPGEDWRYPIKLSEQAAKVSIPGIQQVRRFSLHGELVGDMIVNEAMPIRNERLIVDPASLTRRKQLPADATYENLLVPITREGKSVYESPTLPQIQSYVRDQLARMHRGVKRSLNPHEYPVGLEAGLNELRTEAMSRARSESQP